MAFLHCCFTRNTLLFCKTLQQTPACQSGPDIYSPAVCTEQQSWFGSLQKNFPFLCQSLKPSDSPQTNSWPAGREGLCRGDGAMLGTVGSRGGRGTARGKPHCPGHPPAVRDARCRGGFSYLCARSLGNCTPAISVPLSAASSDGVFLSWPGSCPQGQVSSPVPLSLPREGDAALVSLAGVGRDSGIFSDLCPCHPPAPPSLHTSVP